MRTPATLPRSAADESRHVQRLGRFALSAVLALVLIPLSALPAQTITTTITAGGNFSVTDPAPNATTALAPDMTIQTVWVALAKNNPLYIYAYVTTPSAALTSGSNNVASSRLEIRAGANAFAPMTGNGQGGVGVNGATAQLIMQNITNPNRSSNRTDIVQLRVNLAGTSLPPGTYTGTLRIRAVQL